MIKRDRESNTQRQRWRAKEAQRTREFGELQINISTAVADYFSATKVVTAFSECSKAHNVGSTKTKNCIYFF